MVSAAREPQLLWYPTDVGSPEFGHVLFTVVDLGLRRIRTWGRFL
jgi:hypothetical protein